MHRLVTFLVVLFLLAPSAFTQTTRYVATTGEDTTDCTTEATPCATITYAIDQASDSDAIQIADGEYTEALFIDKSLSLHGESEAGTIIQAHELPRGADSRVITISGDLEIEITELTIRHGIASGDIPDRYGGGIYYSGENANESLILVASQVTITRNRARMGGGIWFHNASWTFTDVTFDRNHAEVNGGGMHNTHSSSSSSLTNVVFSGNSVSLGSGGGMHNLDSSPTLTGVTFSNNSGDGCGGMENYLGSPTLTSVTFIGNSANGYSASGGGFCNKDNSNGVASPMLTDVSFIENTASFSVGGGVHLGGGMYNDTYAGSTPVLTNVTFDGNSADEGGGMYTTGTITLTNATFIENTAIDFGGGIHSHGGITGSSPMLTNVAFSGNTAASGGALASTSWSGNSSSPVLTNCTLSDNNALNGGGIYAESNNSDIFGEITLTNTILWGNTADVSGNEIFISDSSSVVLSFSLYANGDGDIVEGDGGFIAENSLTEDPHFVDPGSGFFQLEDTSPAIDVGHPGTPAGIFTTDENGDPIDLDGNPRFFGGAIDIGAYENQSGAPAPIATVTPETFVFEVPADGEATGALTVSNTGGTALEWSFDEAGGSFGEQDWSDDFDGYDAGSQMHGQGGWKGWDNSPAAGALVSAEEANSTPHSVEIVDDSDLVHEFDGYDSDSLRLTARQFIPDDFDGETYFVLLNTYQDGGPYKWSTQILFDGAAGEASNDTGVSGGTLPLITGEWVELRVEIDLDNDTQEFYYGGELLYTGSWTGEVGDPGALTFEAIDLYANGASAVYYDDVLVVSPSTCETPGDVAWLSASPNTGTTAPGGSDKVTVTVDATDLEPDEYTAFLCATTNDPLASLVEIPVTMTVQGVGAEASPDELAQGLTMPRPNPVSTVTTLTVAAREVQNVTVEVFDVTGRRMQTLYDGALAAGTAETLELDASALPAGVYVIRATGDDFVKTRRVTVVR